MSLGSILGSRLAINATSSVARRLTSNGAPIHGAGKLRQRIGDKIHHIDTKAFVSGLRRGADIRKTHPHVLSALLPDSSHLSKHYHHGIQLGKSLQSLTPDGRARKLEKVRDEVRALGEFRKFPGTSVVHDGISAALNGDPHKRGHILHKLNTAQRLKNLKKRDSLREKTSRGVYKAVNATQDAVDKGLRIATKAGTKLLPISNASRRHLLATKAVQMAASDKGKAGRVAVELAGVSKIHTIRKLREHLKTLPRKERSERFERWLLLHRHLK